MEQISHENYNTGDRDTMSHHNGRLEAMRASSVVIGENRYLPETETVLWRSVQKQKAAGTSQVPGRIIGTDTVCVLSVCISITHAYSKYTGDF
jgi:hypothetical protein